MKHGKQIRFEGKVVNADPEFQKKYPTVLFGFNDIRTHNANENELLVDVPLGVYSGHTTWVDIDSIRIWCDPSALWRLTDEDAQGYAESIFNLARPLNDDELHSIKKGCEWGFGGAQDDVLGTAVREAVNVSSDFESDDDDSMDDEEKDARQRIRRLIQTCFDVPDDKDKVQTTINDVMNNVDEDIVYYEPKKLPEEIEKLGYKLKEK